VIVRVYGELNDFLPVAWRQEALDCPLHGPASIKDFLESLGIPHPEIDVIVVNGEPVDFGHAVLDGDRVAVYPRFHSFDVDPLRAGPASDPEPRFVADVHLGRLTAYLRFAGFDTLYRNDYSDHELVAVSAEEARTLLTRDVGVLKHRLVSRGCFVRAIEPARQLVEVLRRFDLVDRASPFTRCVRCNSLLHQVPKDRIDHLLPPRTREHYRDFSQCPTCGRIFWRGSHHERMQRFLQLAFVAARPASR
jgi:uncharacterized protein with PIN domain/sulfur carrier protein ThiS